MIDNDKKLKIFYEVLRQKSRLVTSGIKPKKSDTWVWYGWNVPIEKGLFLVPENISEQDEYLEALQDGEGKSKPVL